MDDAAPADMTAFLERQDRKSWRLFFVLFSASLVVAAAVFTYGVLRTGTPGSVLADQWLSILFYPLIIGALWAVLARVARKRFKPPGGRYLMHPDDARSVTRVTNAGHAFLVCLGVVMLLSQASLALDHFFDFMGPTGNGLGVLSRAIVAVTGVLVAYLGNATSRSPTPRQPAQKAATQLKFKRLMSWLIVIHGLLLALVAVLLPLRAMPAAVLVVGASMLISLFGSSLIFRKALKSL